MMENKTLFKGFWVYSAAFLVFWIGEQIMYAFQTIILSESMTNMQIGLLLGIGPFATIATAPLLGNCCDRFGTEKVLAVMTFVGAIIGFAFFEEHSFVFFLCIYIGIYTFKNPIDILMNGLATIRFRDNVGKLICWGSIGKVIGPIIAGYLVIKSGVSLSIVMIGLSALIMIFITRVNRQIDVNRLKDVEDISTYRRSPTIKETYSLMMIKPFAMLMISAFVLSLGLKNYWSYSSLAMVETGLSNTQIGWLWCMEGVAGIIVYCAGDRIAKKIGPLIMFRISIVCAFMFFLVVGFFPSLISWIIGMFLGSCAVPFMLLSIAIFIKDNLPERVNGSANSLFCTMAWGFGSGFGGVLGAFLSESSAMIPFKFSVLFAVAAMILSLPVEKHLKCYKAIK